MMAAKDREALSFSRRKILDRMCLQVTIQHCRFLVRVAERSASHHRKRRASSCKSPSVLAMMGRNLKALGGTCRAYALDYDALGSSSVLLLAVTSYSEPGPVSHHCQKTCDMLKSRIDPCHRPVVACNCGSFKSPTVGDDLQGHVGKRSAGCRKRLAHGRGISILNLC